MSLLGYVALTLDESFLIKGTRKNFLRRYRDGTGSPEDLTTADAEVRAY